MISSGYQSEIEEIRYFHRYRFASAGQLFSLAWYFLNNILNCGRLLLKSGPQITTKIYLHDADERRLNFYPIL